MLNKLLIMCLRLKVRYQYKFFFNMVNYNLILDFYLLKILFFMFIVWQIMNVEDIFDVIKENDEENLEFVKI